MKTFLTGRTVSRLGSFIFKEARNRLTLGQSVFWTYERRTRMEQPVTACRVATTTLTLSDIVTQAGSGVTVRRTYYSYVERLASAEHTCHMRCFTTNILFKDVTRFTTTTHIKI